LQTPADTHFPPAPSHAARRDMRPRVPCAQRLMRRCCRYAPAARGGSVTARFADGRLSTRPPPTSPRRPPRRLKCRRYARAIRLQREQSEPLALIDAPAPAKTMMRYCVPLCVVSRHDADVLPPRCCKRFDADAR
jgi:hypothetical protein